MERETLMLWSGGSLQTTTFEIANSLSTLSRTPKLVGKWFGCLPMMDVRLDLRSKWSHGGLQADIPPIAGNPPAVLAEVSGLGEVGGGWTPGLRRNLHEDGILPHVLSTKVSSCSEARLSKGSS